MDKLFSQDDELVFKQTYAIQFIAAYTACRYDNCVTYNQLQTLNQPPVDDAYWLADAAWDEWVSRHGLSKTEVPYHHNIHKPRPDPSDY